MCRVSISIQHMSSLPQASSYEGTCHRQVGCLNLTWLAKLQLKVLLLFYAHPRTCQNGNVPVTSNTFAWHTLAQRIGRRTARHLASMVCKNSCFPTRRGAVQSYEPQTCPNNTRISAGQPPAQPKEARHGAAIAGLMQVASNEPGPGPTAANTSRPGGPTPNSPQKPQFTNQP